MYKRVGTYAEPLAPLVTLAEGLEVYWNVEGYGMSHIDSMAVRDCFWPLLSKSIPGDWQTALLSVLPPGGHIPVHKDSQNTAGTTRYHLVLESNLDCLCFHDGEWQSLYAGGIYTMDETKEHAAENKGQSSRTHLIVDTSLVSG